MQGIKHRSVIPAQESLVYLLNTKNMCYSVTLKKSRKHLMFICCLLLATASGKLYSQAVVEAWGNIKGIRVEGDLMQMESSLDVIKTGWSGIVSTAKERQRPRYRREGNIQTVTTRIDSFYFIQQLEDIGKGLVKVGVQFVSKKDTMLEGLFFHLRLPAEDYGNGSLSAQSSTQQQKRSYSLAIPDTDLTITADTISFISGRRQLQIYFNSEKKIIVKRTAGRDRNYIQVFIPLQEKECRKGDSKEEKFVLHATGTINKEPVTVRLNTTVKGPVFAGFGGNFRLQNPKTDPPVIDYCLQHMRVAWGRVEMPWQLWQPIKDSNAIDAAKAGRLNDHVKKSMEMAARLYKQGMPVILTAWSAPKWAVTGDITNGPRANGVWGNPLDSGVTKEIYQSIADYISYLREVYGVEIALFSFNESDLGINIRQTAQEHANLIKGLGAYFVSRGLKTKMLLGDNSDATSWSFIYPAINDAATHPYIGAISFHSWRGCDTATLQKWKAAATQMNLPLLVGEGSIDAAAWNYPLIFEEEAYAMEEIDLYIRLLAVCQPISILQWQLTADYSPLAGGGIFGNNEPLRPTHRFFNLKQLASIPENLHAIPVTVTGTGITVAAQGNAGSNNYAIHLVNNGASRSVTIKGLPATLKLLQVFITSKALQNQQQQPVSVHNGQAVLTLNAVSYTTLIGS
jgi:hypothetical protein